MIHRILLVIAYDGTNYNGFALQKEESLVTVEATLNQALRQLTGPAPATLQACGAHVPDNRHRELLSSSEGIIFEKSSSENRIRRNTLCRIRTSAGAGNHRGCTG